MGQIIEHEVRRHYLHSAGLLRGIPCAMAMCGAGISVALWQQYAVTQQVASEGEQDIESGCT